MVAGFHLGISSWGGGEAHGSRGHGEGRVDFIIIIIGNILGGGGGGGGGSWVSLGGGGGKLGQFGGGGGGEVELFGGEASPVPPSLDETLGGAKD